MSNNSSLKSIAAKGMAWSAFGTFSTQGFSFVVGIILARILMPSDYGLIGMLAIFFALSQILVEGGFSNALIQKLDRDETDYSTIFYFNLVVSLTIYLILFLTAPLISIFYNAPELTLLTRVLSLNIPIGSLAIVQQARLNIKLDFKTLAIITLISVVISGSTGVFLAYSGFGVWALVIQSLTTTSVRTLLLFFFNKWIPRLNFSYSALKQLFGFSSKLLIAGFIANIVNNLYSILIGKLFSAIDVGFFTRARQFPELLTNTITSILQGVTFPILASMQNERDRMLSVYGRLIRITSFFVLPLLTMLALLAEPFIRLFLTEKWMPVVPLIQWLCFARMTRPLSALNMNILNAIGRSDLYLKNDLSKLPVTLITMAITIPFGIYVVVIGNFFTAVVSFFINAYYPGKLFGYGAIKQIKEMKYVILSTIIMSICVLGITHFIPGDFLKILIGSTLGLSAYLFSAFLMKIEELKEVQKMARQIILKINNHQ